MITFKHYLEEGKKSTEQAKSMGLSHMGFGRWGKDGTILYTTYYNTLIPFHAKANKLAPRPTVEDKKPIVKVKKEKKSAKKPQENDVYEDENLMVHTKALDHDAYHNVGKARGEQPCLYMQMLHTANIKLGTDSKEVMKQYNPKGHYVKGMNLVDLMKGFSNVQNDDGKRLESTLINEPDSIDAAMEDVRKGNPVICMVHTYGGIVYSMGNEKRLIKNMEKFQNNHGVVSVDPNKPQGEADQKDKSDLYHALMLVGYDKAEDMAIFRDSESDFGFNGVDMEFEDKTRGMTPKQVEAYEKEHPRQKRGGFLKVPMEFLKTHQNSVLKYLTLDFNWK